MIVQFIESLNVLEYIADMGQLHLRQFQFKNYN